MAYNPVVGRAGIPQGNNLNSNLNSGQGGDQFSMQNMQPEDYLGILSKILSLSLERANVNTYLREAISLLLENRPENPILFLADQ